MEALAPRESCVLSLKNCSIDKFPKFVENLDCVIGKTGGRRFIVYPQGKEHPCLPGTLSLNDIVKQLCVVWKDNFKGVDPNNYKIMLKIVKLIQDKDKAADVQLSKNNILIRILTFIKRFFGNIGYNRHHTLEWIEVGASISVRLSKESAEADAVKAKPSFVIRSEFREVDTLILTMSMLNESNKNKLALILEKTPEETLYEALQYSYNKEVFHFFLDTMSRGKLESVLMKAAHVASAKNNYQFFTQLILRFCGTFPKEKILNIVRIAVGLNPGRIENIRAEVAKGDHLFKSHFNSLLDAVNE